MIVVDNKELNLSPSNEKPNENEIFVSQWINNLRNEKGEEGVVRLVDKSPLSKNQLIFKPRKGFDVSGRRRNPESGISERWIYCDARPKLRKNGDKYYPVKHLTLFRQADYSVKNDAELLFFLINIVDVSQFGFVIENKQADASQKVTKRKIEFEVGNWINNKCTDGQIVKLAYRWGVPTEVHGQSKSSEELRDELYERIVSIENNKNDKRGFRTFINELNSDSDIMKLATYFYRAIQDKKIIFNPPPYRTCMWANTTEKIGGAIPPERWANDKEEYVIEYLTKNPSEAEAFLATIDGVSDLSAQIDDYMQINNAGALRGYAKKRFGVDIGIMKTEEAKEKIKELEEKMSA